MSLAQDVATQLQRLKNTGFDVKLKTQAEANGFPASYFFAIASRETNCVNMLGDLQNGEMHGVGIVQIDIQHPIARQARDDGSWKTNPDPLVAFGAQLIKNNIAAAKQAFPQLSLDDQMKIAASGYNCGVQSAIAAQRKGDCDSRTTHRDYGKDVMARKALFDQLMG